MERIGIRELRQNASRYIRRVTAGETIEVTDRGRAVARLVPIREPGLAQLIDEGRASEAEGSLLDWEPLALPKGATPPSTILERLRRDER